MARAVALLCFIALKSVTGYYYDNDTLPSTRQLLDFKLRHPKPIGLLTVGSGSPVEIRDMITINSDLFRDEFIFDSQAHLDGERIPERIVQAKGGGAWGFFEVTHDVSKYTKADVFNGIGKRTPVFARMGTGYPGRGGTDLRRDIKSIAMKMYTKEGNLDFLTLHLTSFATKDPIDFSPVVHALDRNPKSNLIELASIWDFLILRPDALHSWFFFQSDYGLPDGWRHMDSFPIHTYELVNKHGDRWYVRFNFRTLQGFKYLTSQQAEQIQRTDLDYYIRDLYNAIENKTYPSWRLDMDVLSLEDIKNVDFNPFDITKLWKNGTYHTVTIGRVTYNRNPDNNFRDVELAAFSPSNLVPGIPGPIDTLFRARRYAYRDAQNYRLGRNHLKVGVNAPLYQKSYVRDGVPPVWDNGKDAPNYFPNSYNGPLPYVDDRRPKEFLQELDTTAADLQEAANFYLYTLGNKSARQRLVDNLVTTLLLTSEPTRTKAIKMLRLVNEDLFKRTVKTYRARQGIAVNG